MPITSILGLMVTIAIFLGGIFWNLTTDRQKQKAARKRYLLALGEEITLNVGKLNKIITHFPNIDEIDARLKADSKLEAPKNYRPLLTFNYNSIVFETRTEVLQDLEKELISSIVDFYGKLSEVATDVAAIESKAYETISDASRRKLFEVILEEHKLAEQHGKDVCVAMKLLEGKRRWPLS